MLSALRDCAILRGLDAAAVEQVTAVAESRRFVDGERPFELGQSADTFFVIVSGGVDLCVPISIEGTRQDVALERKGVGNALGWSAFVRPHRYRLTARAVGDTELAAMRREALIEILAPGRPGAYEFMERIAELTAQRLLVLQALWVRELQRVVHSERPAGVER